jgi:rod shape determining protein RodA
MNWIYKILKGYDWPLLLASVLLLILGLTVVYTSSLANPTLGLFWRQLVFASTGIVVFIAVSNYSYHTLAKYNWIWYLALLLLLLFVLFFGREIRGSSRWIDLGFFRLQPAEFVKIVVIVGLARWFYLFRGQINAWKNLVTTALLVFLPAVLVLLEPDLGSAVSLGAIWFGVLMVSSISKRKLLAIFGIILVLLGLVWQFGLKSYQKDRIETFLNPNLDPKGQGYNLRQALIAVGSGQLLGRGLGRGLQSQLQFLPERQTDFIFATMAEELGFLGTTGVVVLYFIVLARLLVIARKSRDNLGRYLAYGIFFLLFFQIFVNIAMNIGLVPVTGIPLPLMSYGGSSMLVTWFLLGVAQNIAWQSKSLRF